MHRWGQFALWLVVAPVLGAIQAMASFAVVLLSAGHLGSPDLHRLLLGLALVYGGGWFFPALLLSDLALLRRSLSRREWMRYVGLMALAALAIGAITPGMLVMVGYPATACAILLLGYFHRKPAGTSR